MIKRTVIVALLFAHLSLQCPSLWASSPEYFNQVVDAIYFAEGGPKAKIPYGILSVRVSSKEEARSVCYGTVKNNYARWLKSGQRVPFLEFLGARYCPVGATNDPNGLNRHWVKNVRYYLNKIEKENKK